MEKSLKAKKQINILLTHSKMLPYNIKIDNHNISVVKGEKTIGCYSSIENALNKVSKLRTLELTHKNFGEEFPLENYIKSLYKIKNVFNNEVVKSIDEQIQNLRTNGIK